MRALLAIVLLAALAWSGYWWIGSSAYEAGLDGWLEAQKDAGWRAEREELRVIGYPNRFDTQVKNLRLADPDGNWAWSAPEFQILSLSYKPNHIIAVWPGTHRITTRAGSFEFTGELIRGSVVFAPESKLTLERLTLELTDTRMGPLNGPVATLERGILSSRRAQSPEAPEFAHDVSIELSRLLLPEAFIKSLQLRETLPPEIERLSASALLLFDGPWDRTTLADPPRFTGLDIKNFLLAWGNAELLASGRIDITRQGFAEGRLDLEVSNWRTILRVLRESGAVDDRSARSLETGLALLAGFGGNPKRLKVPLIFKNRRAYLGPFEIGPAPKLGQRQ